MFDLRRPVTAILVMAVIVAALLVSGCVTKRDIENIEVRLDRIEKQTAATQRLAARMDSSIAASTQADTRLRNEVMVSVDELQQQLTALLENYNELQRMLKGMQRPPTIKEPPTSSPGAQPDISTAACDETYDNAFVLVRSGKYDQAIQGFRTFLQSCPRHPSVPNAHYWIGESYYSLERFKEAIDEFQKMLDDYPTSVNAARATYKLARSRQELGQKAEAKKVFQQIVDKYPNTLEAEQSKERLKEIR